MKNLKLGFRDYGATDEIEIYDIGSDYAGCQVAIMPDNDITTKQRYSNAERICASVNAFHGVNIESILLIGSVGVLKIAQTVVELQKERQNLLQSLEWALEWIDAVPSETQLPVMPGFDREYVDHIIQKVKSEI